MSQTPEDRPRPAPRPRPTAGRPTPSPRPRVAGSRRDREAPSAAERDTVAAQAPRSRPAAGERAAAEPFPAASPAGVVVEEPLDEPTDRALPRARRLGARRAAGDGAPRSRRPVLALALAVLCLLAAAGGGVLLYQRLHPPYVKASVFQAARDGVEALYAFDYKDAQGSINRKLAVLTGDLHDQYKKDLSQGGIVDTYKQVSATTSYDVVDVGLQQINDAQDSATLVVFGQYKVKSATSGTTPAPQGSECTTTSDGAQSCTQTVQVHETLVDGTWKISDLTLLTTT